MRINATLHREAVSVYRHCCTQAGRFGKPSTPPTHASVSGCGSAISGGVLRLHAENTHVASRCACRFVPSEPNTTTNSVWPVMRKSATTRPQMCFRCRPEGGNLVRRAQSGIPGSEWLQFRILAPCCMASLPNEYDIDLLDAHRKSFMA